jgi:hypothetical protein
MRSAERKTLRSRSESLRLVALLAALCACGGGESAPEPQPAARSSGGEHVEPGERGGMEVSGLLGTIPERKVHAALEPRIGSLQRCFVRGSQQVEFLAGRMEFYFRVSPDGGVEWVYPRSSTVGHRATEQCLLDVAAGTRFPRPQGGTGAEVAWSFEIDPAEDVRAPDAWEAAKVEAVVAEQAATLEPCALASALTVTAYVAPGGQVLAAGASADSRAAADAIDCALSAIAAWPMPDPGSYAAKVSFELP